MIDALQSAKEAIAYLRKEADFNRAWTDGRLSFHLETPEYIARRIQLAEERERWAHAIEHFVEMGSGGEP